ncbi:hypothetical protein BC833DRAFT_615631 [Globomyces pollinis-pini]|nr:hypothetical protein BC833DRAFT_615631 [Globomyces pollinis-pini]
MGSVTIEDTPAELKRGQSSGEFLEKHFEEISFGGSATTENVNMAGAATDFGIAKGWIPAVKEKHISIQYKDQRYDLEVSSYKSMSNVISSPVPFKMLYRLAEDGSVYQLKNVKDLREGYLYYALTVNEELPKKQTGNFRVEMERFFDKLKMEEGKSDEQVKKVRDVFSEQDIEFKQLMATGDLAMTDAKLEQYGITQGGLRTAILSVIRSNV